MLCAQPEPNPRKQLKLAREDSSGSGLVEGSQAGSTEAAQGAEPGGKAVPGQGKAGCPTVRLLALPGGSQLRGTRGLPKTGYVTLSSSTPALVSSTLCIPYTTEHPLPLLPGGLELQGVPCPLLCPEGWHPRDPWLQPHHWLGYSLLAAISEQPFGTPLSTLRQAIVPPSSPGLLTLTPLPTPPHPCCSLALSLASAPAPPAPPDCMG